MGQLSLFGNTVKEYNYTKRLSKSKLNCFINCPKQFQLMNDNPKEGIPGPALIKGIKVHDMFDKLYDYKKQYNSKEEIIKKLMEIEPNEYHDYKEKFAEWQKEMNFPKIENTEEKIYDKEDDIVIKYDRLDFDGKTRIMWDYKTGKLKTALDHEFELILYAYYYMKKTRDRIHYVGIYFADHGKADIIKVTDKRIQRVLCDIHNYISEIKDCENSNCFPARKTWKCRFCSWNHLCEVYNK